MTRVMRRAYNLWNVSVVQIPRVMSVLERPGFEASTSHFSAVTVRVCEHCPVEKERK